MQQRHFPKALSRIRLGTFVFSSLSQTRFSSLIHCNQASTGARARAGVLLRDGLIQLNQS